MKAFRPVLFLTIVLMLVGLACSALSSGGNTPEPPVVTKVPVQVTEAPATERPTEEATEAPTEVVVETEAAPESRDFFVEEFDSDFIVDDWQMFTLGTGDEDNLVIEPEDDYMVFDLGDEDLYVYYMYAPYTYGDVSIRLSAQNRGRNNNNVSLICRMNDDGTQWYEFSVESGGLWFLYAVDGGYNRIGNGGVNSLKQGKEVNEYRMDCVGEEITLYVNDTKLTAVKDSKYFFNEGFVGFNISSLNVLPITVEVNWFEIAVPE